MINAGAKIKDPYRSRIFVRFRHKFVVMFCEQYLWQYTEPSWWRILLPEVLTHWLMLTDPLRRSPEKLPRGVGRGEVRRSCWGHRACYLSSRWSLFFCSSLTSSGSHLTAMSQVLLLKIGFNRAQTYPHVCPSTLPRENELSKNIVDPHVLCVFFR